MGNGGQKCTIDSVKWWNYLVHYRVYNSGVGVDLKRWFNFYRGGSIMATQFDPYHKWLGIPPTEQPPHYYRLLGIAPFEPDGDVIEGAASRQMSYLRECGLGPQQAFSQKLLNEVSAAKLTLLNPQKKAFYDQQLRNKLLGAPQRVQAAVQRPVVPFIRNEPTTVSQAMATRHANNSMPLILAAVGGAVLLVGGIGFMAISGEAVVAVNHQSGTSTTTPETTTPPKSPVVKQADNPEKMVPRPVAPRPVAPSPPDTVPESPATSNPFPNSKGGRPIHSQTLPTPSVPWVPEKNTQTPEGEPGEGIGRPPIVNPNIRPPLGNRPIPTFGEGQPPASNPREPNPREFNPEPVVEEVKREPVPEKELLTKAEQVIKEVFKERFMSRVPQEQAALAQELFKSGSETKDAPSRYVMLREARDLAAGRLVCDLKLALDIVDAMDKSFEIEAVEEKFAVVKAVTPNLRLPNASQILSHVCLQLSSEAMEADKYDTAKQLVAMASAHATRSKNFQLVTQLKSRPKEIDQLKREYEKVIPALDKLKTSPDDPDANLLVGAYYCQCKNDFYRGLPLLAKGQGTLAELAKTELSHPTDTTARLKLADGWWSASEPLADLPKIHLQLHAGPLYQQLLADVQGLDKLQVESRLKQMPDPSKVQALSGSFVGKVCSKKIRATWENGYTYPCYTFYQDGTFTSESDRGLLRGKFAVQFPTVITRYENGFVQYFDFHTMKCQHKITENDTSIVNGTFEQY